MGTRKLSYRVVETKRRGLYEMQVKLGGLIVTRHDFTHQAEAWIDQNPLPENAETRELKSLVRELNHGKHRIK